jgi:hypothetical protein
MLTLQFENPLLIRIVGLKVSLTWGPRYEPSADPTAAPAWWDRLRREQFPFKGPIEPAAMSTVDVNLRNSKPTDLGYVEIELRPDAFEMLRKP